MPQLFDVIKCKLSCTYISVYWSIQLCCMWIQLLVLLNLKVKRTGIFSKTDNVELRLEQLEIHREDYLWILLQFISTLLEFSYSNVGSIKNEWFFIQTPSPTIKLLFNLWYETFVETYLRVKVIYVRFFSKDSALCNILYFVQ